MAGLTIAEDKGLGRTVLAALAAAACAMALAGAAILRLGHGSTAAATPAPLIHLLGLTVAFAVAETVAVHLEVRGEVRAVSTAELPLVVGLLFFSPGQVVAARLMGAAVAVVARHRLHLVAVAFDQAGAVLQTAVACAVYGTVLAQRGPFGPVGVAAAVAAVGAADLVGGAALVGATSLLAGRVERDLPRALARVQGAASLAQVALGLAACALIGGDAAVAWLLVVPLVLALAGLRAQTTLRQRYANLELLYDFSRSIGDPTTTDDALSLLLGHVAPLLRAEECEITVLSVGGKVGATTSRRRDGSVETRPTHLRDGTTLERIVIDRGDPVLVPRGSRETGMAALIAARHRRDALAVPLRAGGKVVGVLTVANRIGPIGTFERDDVRLLETVAVHVGATLSNRDLIDRLQREAAEKEHQSLHDALTGLPNRTKFHQDVNHALANRTRNTVVMLMDLDRFKDVNDTLGHHIGDVLLVSTATRLHDILVGLGSVARLGGDEFAVVLPDVDSVTDAETIARLLLAALERPFRIAGLELAIGASIGIAACPDHAATSSELLQHADVAMYAAKADRTGWAVYAVERDQSNARSITLAAELRTAIERRQLTVAYQPKADLGTQRISGVEALVRWNHPELGPVPPDEFVPVAEQTGLIRELTDLVLAQALVQCRRWSELGFDLTVAVNLSARSLVDGDLAAMVQRQLATAAVPASRLVLELTESMIMADPVRSLQTMERLAGLGVTLSIDDFGTGYSSLSHLRRLPVSEVKIDRSFVKDMAIDEDDAIIVRSVVDLGRNLHLRVVAEGVEDARTLAALRDLGCDAVQGFGLSKPLTPDTFAGALRRRGVDLAAWMGTAADDGGAPAARPLRLLGSIGS